MTTIMPIITIFAFYRFHSKNLTFRFHSKYYFPAYLIAYILLVIAGSISDWLPQVPLKFPFLIAAIIYPFFLFKDRYTKRIFCVLFSYLLYMISELLVLFLLSFCLKLDTSSLVSSTLYQSIGSFLADLLLLSIVEIIIRSKKNKPSVIDNFRVELLFIVGINVLFITVLSGLFYYNNLFLTVNTAINLMLFSTALISIIASFTLYKVSKKSEELMQTNLKMQQIEMENKLMENIADVVNNLRNLRHDMNNHLGILQGLLSLGEYKESTQYLDSLLQDLKIANNVVLVDNKFLSILMNSKISKALALNIPIETNIHVSTFPLSDKDLCALIGNILENAIEAAAQTDQPYISFTMEKANSNLLIYCENSFSVIPIFHNGELITTKSDKKYHGIGTQIIKSTVDHYHGQTDIFVTDLFHVSISIPY